VEGDDYNNTVVIYGNGSVTISDLQVGDKYTVTEIDSWAWRYGTNASIESEALVPNPDHDHENINVVTFGNQRSNGKWLSGDNFAKNIFGKQKPERGFGDPIPPTQGN